MSVVNVSVAIIKDASGRFLITRRALDISHGGFWEVPGGKVEPLETPHDALLREVREEVGLHVETVQFIGKVRHAYPEKKVCLHVFQVLEYTGDAICNDGQLDLRWVFRQDLDDFEFPEANYAVMQLVK
ncbi:MAG: 8-oxo-dGTP diphosphatase MutT [Gammaproteobacteria bacterium]|nr:8-oxo-dGTP diphosphatase MutT [Gammaproteobacteria bacterium]